MKLYTSQKDNSKQFLRFMWIDPNGTACTSTTKYLSGTVKSVFTPFEGKNKIVLRMCTKNARLYPKSMT